MINIIRSVRIFPIGSPNVPNVLTMDFLQNWAISFKKWVNENMIFQASEFYQ